MINSQCLFYLERKIGEAQNVGREKSEGNSNLLTTHNDDMKCIYGIIFSIMSFWFSLLHVLKDLRRAFLNFRVGETHESILFIFTE